MGKLPEIAIQIESDITLNIISDVTDNKFLELAVYAKADYLLTGNVNDFVISDYENVKNISPKKFCELFESRK